MVAGANSFFAENRSLIVINIGVLTAGGDHSGRMSRTVRIQAVARNQRVGQAKQRDCGRSAGLHDHSSDKSRLTISFLSYDERLGKALVLAEKSVQLYRDLACLSGIRSLNNRQQLAQARRIDIAARVSWGATQLFRSHPHVTSCGGLMQATARRWPAPNRLKIVN